MLEYADRTNTDLCHKSYTYTYNSQIVWDKWSESASSVYDKKKKIQEIFMRRMACYYYSISMNVAFMLFVVIVIAVYIKKNNDCFIQPWNVLMQVVSNFDIGNRTVDYEIAWEMHLSVSTYAMVVCSWLSAAVAVQHRLTIFEIA